MNYTRLLWGETLNCTRFHTEYASVMSLAVMLLLIPPTFYIVMKVYGTKKEKEIIRRKLKIIAVPVDSQLLAVSNHFL